MNWNNRLLKVLSGIVLWVTGLVAALILVLLVIINSAPVQDRIVDVAEKTLSKRTGAEISLDRFRMFLPNVVTLKGLLVRNPGGDTLLSVERLSLHLAIMPLIDREIHVSSLAVDSPLVFLSRNEASGVFNYQYIIDSLSGQKPKKKQTNSWKVSAGEIALSDPVFMYRDYRARQYIHVDGGTLDLSIHTMDLDSLSFDIETLSLDQIQVALRQSAIEEPTGAGEQATSESEADVTISWSRIALASCGFLLYDSISDTNLEVRSGDIQVEEGSFSLAGQKVSTSSIAVKGAAVHYTHADSTESTDQENRTTEDHWSVRVQNLTMSDTDLGYHNSLSPDLGEGFDPNHLDVRLRRFDLAETSYDTALRTEILDLNLIEHNGLKLVDMHGSIHYAEEHLQIGNLSIRTDSSDIVIPEAEIRGFRLDSTMLADISIEGALHTGDVLYGAPQFADYIPYAAMVDFDVRLTKGAREMYLEKLDLNGPGFDVQGSGRGGNIFTSALPAVDSMRAEGFFVPQELRAFVPDSLWPNNMQLPDTLDFRLYAAAEQENMHALLEIKSGAGNIRAALDQFQYSADQFRIYKADLHVGGLAAGRIVNQKALGNIDGRFSLEGALEDTSMLYTLKGVVHQLEYAGHSYNDMDLQAVWDDPQLSLEVHAREPELMFDLNGQVDLGDRYLSAHGVLDLHKADLQAMHISNDINAVRGQITLEADTLELGRLNGSLAIRDVDIVKDGEIYHVDSLLAVSVEETGRMELRIDSDAFMVEIESNLPLLEIPGNISRYLTAMQPEAGDTVVAGAAPFMQFELDLRNSQVLTDVLLPRLKVLDIETFRGHLDSAQQVINLEVEIPELQYGAFEVNDLFIHTEPLEGNLQGQISIAQLGWSGLTASDISVGFTPRNDTVFVVLDVAKSDTAFLKLGAGVYMAQGFTALHILPGSIVLNGNAWSADPDNLLVLGDSLHARQFRIWRGDGEIRAEHAEGDAALRIAVDALDLTAFGAVFDTEQPVVGGRLNAQITVRKEQNIPEGKFKLEDLTVRGTAVGEVQGSFDRIESGIRADIRVAPESGQLQISGVYHTAGQQQLDLTAAFGNVGLASFAPFARSFTKSLQGTADGNIAISGPPTRPAFEGQLHLRDVEMQPTYLGTPITIVDETLHLQGDVIKISDFTVLDVEQHEATLDGTVGTNNFSELLLDISFDVNDFITFNTGAENDKIFYGKAIIDAHGTLSGPTKALKIDGDLTLAGGSEITVVLPESNSAVLQRDKIVNFIDKDGERDPFFAGLERDETDTVLQFVEGIDLQANVSIDEESVLRLLIDQQFGDRLEVQGKGNISFHLRPDGKMVLTGRYSIVDGSYLLNFRQLVKREFQIQGESYIQWTGAPTEARLDVQAQYQLETRAPVGDIAEPLPFDVNLNIQGKLLEPELSFGIAMPGDAGNRYSQVAAYIQDINRNASDLNKQVMSLILFRSFITGQEMAAGSGPGLSNTARTSLSRFLTQQINNLATGVEGLTLDVNLESYEMQTEEGPAGATNLELGLSQSLFSDRLTIRVSGDVYLENPGEDPDEVMDYLDDVSIEYELTEDGNFQLVGFTQNEYDGLSQGEITETGVGIIYTKDYDKLRELFGKGKDEEQK
jgi:hypothetical protein